MHHEPSHTSQGHHSFDVHSAHNYQKHFDSLIKQRHISTMSAHMLCCLDRPSSRRATPCVCRFHGTKKLHFITETGSWASRLASGLMYCRILVRHSCEIMRHTWVSLRACLCGPLRTSAVKGSM